MIREQERAFIRRVNMRNRGCGNQSKIPSFLRVPKDAEEVCTEHIYEFDEESDCGWPFEKNACEISFQLKANNGL